MQQVKIACKLVRRCVAHYPDSQWLIQTEKHIAGYYEKIGFKFEDDVVLTKPSKYQRND